MIWSFFLYLIKSNVFYNISILTKYYKNSADENFLFIVN